MRKKEIIQQVMDACGLEHGDRTVAMKIATAFDTVAGQLFSTNANQWEFYSKQVTLPVVNRVATLTTALIQTPRNGNGVPRCAPTGSSCKCFPDDTVFYPSPPYGISINVDAAKLSWFVTYRVTGNEVRFSNNLPSGVTEVIAIVIPQFHEWGDTEYIQFPTGAAQMIIDMSIQAVRNDPAFTNIYKKKS